MMGLPLLGDDTADSPNQPTLSKKEIKRSGEV